MDSIIRLKLIYKSKSIIKTILLSNDLTSNDINNIILSSFNNFNDNNKIIAFINNNNNIIIPYSLVINNPLEFHNITLDIVLSNDDIENNHVNNDINNNGSINNQLNNQSIDQLDEQSYYTIEMAEAAFYFLDINGDSKLHFNEMYQSLLLAIQSFDLTNYSIDLITEDLTYEICQLCFIHCKRSIDSYLSLNEFTNWYLSSYNNIYCNILIKSIESYYDILNQAKPKQSIRNNNHNNIVNTLDAIKEIKQATGFYYITIKVLIDALKSNSIINNYNRYINKKDYIFAYENNSIYITNSVFMKRLLSLSEVTSSNINKDKINQLLSLLYNTLNHNSNDKILLSNLLSGLSIFFIDIIDNNTDSYINTNENRLLFRQLYYYLYDIKYNQTNYISDNRLRNYFFYLITILLNISDGLNDKLKCDVITLSIYIYSKVVSKIDREASGKWTLNEFIDGSVYGIDLLLDHIVNNIPLDSKIHFNLSNPLDDNNTQMVSKLIDHYHLSVHLIDARIIFGFHSITSFTIIQIFKHYLNNEYHESINNNNYYIIIDKLIKKQYINNTTINQLFLDYYIYKFFHLFYYLSNDLTTNLPNECDLFDIIICYITISNSTNNEKSKCILELLVLFNEIAIDSDNLIDIDYLAMCLEPIILTISSLNSNINIDKYRDVIEDISYNIANYAMIELFNNQSLTTEQFELWFNTIYYLFDCSNGQELLDQAIFTAISLYSESDSQIDSDVDILNDIKNKIKSIYQPNQSTDESNQDSDLLNLSIEIDNPLDSNTNITVPAITTTILAELQTSSKLLGISVLTSDELLDTFGETLTFGYLTISKWFETLSYLLCLSNVSKDKYDDSSELAIQLFNQFIDESVDSTKDDKKVIYNDFISGLVVLTNSPIEDKLAVSYALVDSSGDGLITVNEFHRLILSHLKVTTICSSTALEKYQSIPNLQLNDLAIAIVDECLAALGLTHSSHISLDMLCEVATDCLILAENISI